MKRLLLLISSFVLLATGHTQAPSSTVRDPVTLDRSTREVNSSFGIGSGKTLTVEAGGALNIGGTTAFSTTASKNGAVDALGIGNAIYLSTSGSDSNAGTRAAPLLTSAAALTKINNSGEIILLAGGYTGLKFDLSSAHRVYIHSEPGQRVRIYLGEKATSFTVDSSPRYYATVAAGYDFTDRTNSGGVDRLSWVFEENTPEGLIVDPRGRERRKLYQLDHTRLWRKTSAANVTGSSQYFYDSGTHRLYLRASDSAAPPGRNYWIPSQTTSASSFVYGCTAATDLTLEGIEVYFAYDGVDLGGVGHAVVRNCVFFGNFNQGLGAEDFGSIESYSNIFAANGNDGCGFGNATATQATFLQVDPWVLRNGDDGDSSHQLVTVTRIGGLYEDNASGGITDAQGAEFNLISPYTRHNGYDFTGPGTATGNGGIATGVYPAVNGTISNWTSDHDLLGIYGTASDTQFTILSASESGTTVTIATNGAHGWKTGQTVTVAWGAGGTSGYTGVQTLTGVPTTSTATYTAAGSLTTPATLGAAPTAYRNSVITLVNPTVISPDVTKWAFGAATGVILNVTGENLINVVTPQAGAGTVHRDVKPSFYAELPTTALSVGSFAKLTGFVESYDNAARFSGGTFTPGRLGWYRMAFTLTFSSPVATRTAIAIYKNGVSYLRILDFTNDKHFMMPATATVLCDSATDYFEIYSFVGNAASTDSTAGSLTNWSASFVDTP